MLEELEDADVVVASRYAPGGGVDPNWHWSRKQISFWGNWGIRRVLGIKTRDVTAGFKLFRSTALQTVGVENLKLSGYGFQAEMAYRCEKARLRVREHPYVFMERTAGKSKMSLAIAFEALFRLTWLRIRG